VSVNWLFVIFSLNGRSCTVVGASKLSHVAEKPNHAGSS